MSINGIPKKTVIFNFERNTEHKCTVLYPKGLKKPTRADEHNQHSVPVDLAEKAIIKAYLENEDEQYKDFILIQYIDNQDGSYQLKFVDPISKQRYTQTIMRERIDEILNISRTATHARANKLN